MLNGALEDHVGVLVMMMMMMMMTSFAKQCTFSSSWEWMGDDDNDW